MKADKLLYAILLLLVMNKVGIAGLLVIAFVIMVVTRLLKRALR